SYHQRSHRDHGCDLSAAVRTPKPRFARQRSGSDVVRRGTLRTRFEPGRGGGYARFRRLGPDVVDGAVFESSTRRTDWRRVSSLDAAERRRTATVGARAVVPAGSVTLADSRSSGFGTRMGSEV